MVTQTCRLQAMQSIRSLLVVTDVASAKHPGLAFVDSLNYVLVYMVLERTMGQKVWHYDRPRGRIGSGGRRVRHIECARRVTWRGEADSDENPSYGRAFISHARAQQVGPDVAVSI